MWPTFQELKTKQQQLAVKIIELENKEAYLLRLNQAKASLEEHKEELVNVFTALPQDPSLPSLFNYLQQNASESGLILEGISFSATSASEDFPGLKETSFSIKIVGSYSSFKHFVSLLERSARLIATESISFSYKEDEESEESFSFDLNMKVYSEDDL